ncbi:MAG: cytochrome c biogenesis protein [Acidobacteriota bacterium]|nr:cytochrome c biogenesis protein [Blastocatellia bacterium]MDW8411956.1 cytochrome c biogenesis protein [Acidobacteriota bacterium]
MRTLLVIAVIMYTTSTLVAATQIKKKLSPPSSVLLTAVAGIVFHSGAIATRWIEVGRFPLILQAEVLCFLGWCIAAYFIFSSILAHTHLLGYTLLLAIIPTSVAAALPSPAVTPAKFRPFEDTLLFPLHATMIILAYAAFIITFLAGVLYIWQEYKLKKKRPASLKLPGLDTCDELSYRSMSIGFVALTLGIVSGFVWSRRHFGTYLHGDPIEILTLTIWLLYFFMIHYRITAGWRGRRTAIIAVVGFVFVLFILFGLQYLGGFHVFSS